MRTLLEPGRVFLRHVKLATAADAGALQVNDVWFAPQDMRGVNGRLGFISGDYEPRLTEEGAFSVAFPNGAGEDGVLHRQRFLALTDPDYRPGEEWLEVYREPWDLLFVGTVTKARVVRQRVELSGYSAPWLQKKQRETAIGIWNHAPRDVFDHYTRAWQARLARDFLEQSYAFATGQSTSDDGHFSWKRATNVVGSGGAAPITDSGKLRLEPNRSSPQAGSNSEAWGADAYAYRVDPGGSDRYARWRAEWAIQRISHPTTDASTVVLGLGPADTDPPYFLYQGDQAKWSAVGANTAIKADITPQVGDLGAPHVFAIEGDGRWAYFYVDEKLVAVEPAVPATTAVGHTAHVWIKPTSTSVSPAWDLEFVVFRVARPLLARAAAAVGDLHLAGAPPPTGLLGSYFTEAYRKPTELGIYDRMLVPVRDPVDRRLDHTLNFTQANPPAWQPDRFYNAEHWSVRWTGAIYLDLDNYDYGFRFTQLAGASKEGVRLWIGRTRLGEENAVSWPNTDAPLYGKWVKAGSTANGAPSGSSGTLAGLASGWYPIVLEYAHTTGAAGLKLEYERSDAVGTWNVVGDPAVTDAPKLSPLGVYDQRVRFDSHFEQLRELADTFGMQWTCEPKQLESGEFPGRVVLRERVGRDTEKVLSSHEGSDISVDVDAENVVDVLVLDAAGVADPDGGGQLTKEALVFERLNELRLLVHTDQDSLAEITIPELLQQRADSLIALRQSPWEEVGARPTSKREFLDGFPLAGDLATFAWEEGDGIRLDLPDLGIRDITPRQIKGVNWPFVPDGLGIPQASFRQRPRGLREVLRAFVRRQAQHQRNYQGQLAVVPGSVGAAGGAAGAADAYSRLNLPRGLIGQGLLRVVFVVQSKSDASTWDIEINGTNRTTFDRPGRYDVTAWTGQQATGRPQMIARGVGGTGSALYALELTRRI